MKKWKNVLMASGLCSVLLTACATQQVDTFSDGEQDKATIEQEAANVANKESQKREDDKSKPRKAEKPTIVTMGHHNLVEVDPTYLDPVTGEPAMAIEQRQAFEKALETVKEELNVELKFLEYPGSPTEVLLQSVLAGDPICDIAWLWNTSQGTILGQNILQPLDEYEYIFEGDDEWMLWDEVMENRFFINKSMEFVPRWPLVYNINYIESVDALKENGETIYPTDLFLEGKWTWSVFEEYLAKIDAHYKNSKAPIRTERRIQAYQTDYRESVLHASHANGAGIYTGEGLEAGSYETKEAVKYVEKLMDGGLLTTERPDQTRSEPGWHWHSTSFENGETVFTNYVAWKLPTAATKLGERGQSIGIVPFPRPDRLAFDDPTYQQPGTAADCAAVLKGVSKEQTELALETFKLYFSTYYKELAGGEKATDYLESKAELQASKYGLDIFYEDIGPDILDTFIWMGKNLKVNDFSQLTGLYYKSYSNILGDALYGLNNSPAYDIAIESNRGSLDEYINGMMDAINSNEIRDNIPPKISIAKTLVFPQGMKPEEIQWNEYIKGSDNCDGDIPVAVENVDYSNVDFNQVGIHQQTCAVTIQDTSENQVVGQVSIMIYDPLNTTEPTVTIKEEYRKITIDENVDEINWAKDFIDQAIDKDGLDVKQSTVADLSTLDTTTKGVYEVELTITDYAGNQQKVSINVEVE